MQAHYVPGVGVEELLDPNAVVWKSRAGEQLKLEGTPAGMQPTDAIRTAWADKKIGAIGSVDVLALHDGRHLAIRLEWADPTENSGMGDNDRFVDAAAVAFPATDNAPLITMGAPGLWVNAWYWRADDEGGRHVVAEGLGTSETLDDGLVRARGSWSNGRWQVVITRALRVEGNQPVVQLQARESTSFGVAIWEGGNGERAGIKAVSGFAWLPLDLEPATTRGGAK